MRVSRSRRWVEIDGVAEYREFEHPLVANGTGKHLAIMGANADTDTRPVPGLLGGRPSLNGLEHAQAALDGAIGVVGFRVEKPRIPPAPHRR